MSALCCAQKDPKPDKDALTFETMSPPPRARFTAAFGPMLCEDDLDSISPCVSFQDEPLAKERAHRKPPINVRKRWRKAAIWTTFVCIIVSLLFSLASSIASSEYQSDSSMATAFDCSLAVFGSFAVLWRFRSEENGKFGLKRERCCCVVFGSSFVISGTITFGISIGHIIGGVRPDKSGALLLVLTLASIVYAALGTVQFYISQKLRSSAMLASAIDSALSAILIFGLLFGDFIYNVAKDDLWYLDHAMAAGVAIISIVCGVKILVELLIDKTLPIEAFT